MLSTTGRLLRLLFGLLCLVLGLLYVASVWLAVSPPRRQSLRTALVVLDQPGAPMAMHWNINTAAEPDRLAEIGAVIRMHAPALVGLNEVALGPSAFAKVAKAWPHDAGHNIRRRQQRRGRLRRTG